MVRENGTGSLVRNFSACTNSASGLKLDGVVGVVGGKSLMAIAGSSMALTCAPCQAQKPQTFLQFCDS
jgi:hypothetical protein